MPRILESDAIALARNIDSMPENQRPQAASILQAYKEQQEADGLPHWPQLMADQERETKRFRSMFESLSNVDGAAPAIAPVVKYAADPDEHRARVASTAFLATRYGKPADEISNGFELYAADYAAKNWNESKPLDSKGFYARAKTEIQGEIDREDLTNSLGEAVTKAALLNDKTAWQAWKDSAVTHPGWKPELEGQLFEAWRAADKKIKADMGDNAALIRRTVESLQSKTGVESNAAEWTHPEYDLRELLINDPAGYKKTLRLIGRVATVAAKDNKEGVLGWFQKAGESLARGVEGIGEGFVADAQRGAAAVAGVVGADDTAKLNDASVRVARDLRDIANGVVDPVKRNNWLDTMIFGGLESTPGMVAGMTGPLNAALLMKGQYAGDAEKHFEEQGWTGAGSKAAAQAVGVAAAAVESMSEMFGATKWGKAAMQAIGAGPESKFATRYFINSTLRGASEFSEELVQDNLAAATQSMLNAVGASVGAPAPFMEEVSGWVKTQGADTALVVLPLALLGAGLTTSQEIGEAKANALLGDVSQTSKLIGREAADRIAAISDPQARAAEFQKVYQSQSAANRQEWLAASSELEKAKAEFAAATNTEAEAQALSITHDESGWRLNMADGGTVRVDSAQAAVSLRSDLMQARTEDEARALVSVVEDWQKSAPAGTMRETNFTGEQVKLGSDGQLIGERAGGDVRVIDSPQLLRDIRSQAQSTGLGAEIDLVVNGSNSVFAQSVNEASRQIVQRLEINRSNEQAPIITVLHEQLEANLKAANLGGVVSTQETMSALTRVADALPVVDAQQRLASLERRKAPQSHIEEARRELDLRQRIQSIANGEGDEAAIREIAVELAVADVIARDKSGMKTGFRAGSVSAALDSAISKAVTTGEIRALGKFRAFLRSVRAWVRSVLGTVAGFQKARRDGKLTDGDAWNAWLDKVTGVTEQARYDQELADELKAIAGQDETQYGGPSEGQAFSLSRAVPADASNVVQMPDGAQLVGPTTFSISEYGIQHRPNDEGPRAFDLAEGDMMPMDVYEHPEWYSAMDGKVIRETMAQLRKVRGKPDALVDIFRAGPVGEMNQGDWVSLSKEYARTHAESQDPDGYKVWTAKVPAKEVRWDMNDIAEFGYFGDNIKAVDSGVSFSITAYHGTPHKVDKFSLDKIGTGEGAQAYGWGLNFAESRDVGEMYRDTVTSAKRERLPKLQEKLAFWNQFITDAPEGSQTPEQWRNDRAKAESEISKISQQIAILESAGNLYTVELLPDESEFLDWDKPLSEQGEKVKVAFLKAMKECAMHNPFESATPMSGREGYNWFSAIFGQGEDSQKSASEYMASLGIPGIKYLDGGSRGAGDGTRNYVIFDENLVRILEENGKPVEERSFSLSRVTPAQDAEYMRAVESGDMEKAQRMVDEAARKAGFNVRGYHGTNANAYSDSDFTVFNTQGERGASFFSSKPEEAKNYGEKVYNVALAMVNPLVIDANGGSWTDLTEARVLSTPTDALIQKRQKFADESIQMLRDLGISVDESSPLRPIETVEDLSASGVDTDALAKFARKYGYDGVVFRNVKDSPTSGMYANEPQDTFAVFSPSQIKSADPVTRDESGNVIPLSQRFNPADNRITFSLSRVTPAQDADYMRAVESGDMETAQRMVDEAAKAAGYNEKAFHGTNKEFDAFSRDSVGSNRDNGFLGTGFYFSTDEAVTKGKRRSVAAYLKLQKPLRIQMPNSRSLASGKVKADEMTKALGIANVDASWVRNKEEGVSYLQISKSDADRLAGTAIGQGYDGVILDYSPTGYNQSEMVVFDPNQIKSADPVTRDESGNIILLSQRFNPADNRITFSLSRVTPAQDADYMRAVESGDMAKAQAMVDEAAKSSKGRLMITLLPRDMKEQLFNEYASFVNPEAKQVIFNTKKVPYGEMDIRGILVDDIPASQLQPMSATSKVPPLVIADGKLIDGQHRINSARQIGRTSLPYIDVTGLTDIDQAGFISTIPAVTRDESGQVIPLSQRFNPADDRITFSLSPSKQGASVGSMASQDQAAQTPSSSPGGLTEAEAKQYEAGRNRFGDLHPDKAADLWEALANDGVAFEFEGTWVLANPELQGIPSQIAVYGKSKLSSRAEKAYATKLFKSDLVPSVEAGVAAIRRVPTIRVSEFEMDGLNHQAASLPGPFHGDIRKLQKWSVPESELDALRSAPNSLVRDEIMGRLLEVYEPPQLKDYSHLSAADFEEMVRERLPSMPVEKVKLAVASSMRSRGMDWSDLKGSEFDVVAAIVRPFVRHEMTAYDQLLRNGAPKDEARSLVLDNVEATIEQWSRPNNEAAKVSQGGFNKGSDSSPGSLLETTSKPMPEATMVGGQWPNDNSPSPPAVNSFDTSAPSLGASFSISPARNLELVQSAIDSQLSRDPDKRLKLAASAMQKLEALRSRWMEEGWTALGHYKRPLVERRGKASLDKEQSMRQATRERELLDLGMNSLSQQQAETYFNGLMKLEEHPLVFAMLNDNGRLMSKTTAEAQGKLKTDGVGNAGDYDSAPWLPPSWYRNGGGIMPDAMAQALYDDGKLKEPTADALWSALSSVIESHRKAKAAYGEAEAAVMAVEKSAKDQAKADAQAWRDEYDARQAKDWNPRAALVRDLQLLDSVLSVMPPEVRGKVGGFVKLAQLATEDARVKELQRRVSRMDTLLEDYLANEYRERIDKLLDKAAPKMKPGEKPKGSMAADAHRLVKLVRESMSVSEDAMDERRAAIEKAMAEDAANMPDLLERAQVLEMFGGFDKLPASELAIAHDWLDGVVKSGRNRWKIVEEARLVEQQARAKALKADTGKSGDPVELQNAIEAEKTIAKTGVGLGFSLISFPQTVRSLFGDKSQAGQRLIDMARRATSARTDAIIQRRAEFKAAMRSIFGTTDQAKIDAAMWEHSQVTGKLGVTVKWSELTTKSERVPRDVVERMMEDRSIAKALGFTTNEVDELERAWLDSENDGKSVFILDRMTEGPAKDLNLSQMQAIHLLMMATQKPEALARHGYTADVLDEIESKLTNEAKLIRAWLLGRYRDGYQPLNAVFQRMYGAPLPQISGYSPMTFEGMQDGGMLTPEGGSQGFGGMSPGALKTRRNHNAKPRLEDALAVYWSHAIQTEHFIHFAEPVRDMRSTLLQPDTRAAVQVKAGVEGLNALKNWVHIFENDGMRKAGALTAIERLSSKLQSAVSVSALAWNVGTMVKQSLAALGALYKMPTRAYLRGLSRVLSGKIDIRPMFESAIIRRRVEAGATPELRQVMAGYMAEHPGKWSRRPREFVNYGMELLGKTDGFFTAISAAIYHDHISNEMKASGMGEAEASALAMRETEAMIGDTAQPVELMDRSLFEAGNAASPNARWLFMFASESRQKTALYGVALHRIATGRGTKQDARIMLVSHVIAPLMLQTITNIIRDARSDDDDEVFDMETWSPMRYLQAMAMGPLSGLPLIQEASNPMLDMIQRSYYGIKGLFDDRKDAEPIEKGTKAAKAALNAVSLASIFPGLKPLEWLGAGANGVGQLFDWLDNLQGKDKRSGK